MKFLRKNRFNILIVFLVLVLIVVSFYMLWVHVPYSKHKNEITSIENVIVKENFDEEVVDMFSIVIVGNSQSFIKNGKFITPRGYDV